MRENKKKTIENLIKSIKSGKDDGLFEMLYQDCFPNIKKMILSKSGTEDDAKDIFQDAVLTFYKQVKLDKYQQQGEIGGFLYVVSKNLWFNRLKVKNRSTQMDASLFENRTDFRSPESEYFDSEKNKGILELFDKIGERCKELMINRLYNDMSMEEVAKHMNFSTVNAAKTKNYKCKKRLMKLVQESEYYKTLLNSYG